MNNREELIAALSNDLRPVRKTVGIDWLAMGWLLICSSWVIAVTHVMGPIRPNAITQLMENPQFLIETLFGLLAMIVGTLVAFRSSVPGALNSRLSLVMGALIVGWISFYVAGLSFPALEPSMLGKRETCVWQTMVYALPPMALAFAITKRFYPLQPVRTAMSFSLVAGLLPALYMQIACMYVPSHILKFHILPGMLVVLVGAAIALAIKPRKIKG